MEKKITINSIEELQKFVYEFLQLLLSFQTKNHQATVVALSGDLGAGKTTFTQTLAEGLKIKDTVSSPTFNIIKIYQIDNSSFKKLIHMDAYRLENLSELKPLGLAEFFLDSKNLICIEWAEKIKTVLPENTIYLDLSIQEGNKREIIVKNLA